MCYKLLASERLFESCMVLYDCKGCTSFACRWSEVWIGEDVDSVLDVLMFLHSCGLQKECI